MTEIGSEFWGIPSVDSSKKYLLSGRTALEYIIRDIKKQRRIDAVLLPSYCCHSMIEPFLRHEISVRFYEVFYDRDKGLCARLPEKKKNEIFYYMTYFGFSEINGIDIGAIRANYDIIIEDKTHSYLSGQDDIGSDYAYSSLRKWAGFYGLAEAQKREGEFLIEPVAVGTDYSSIRKEAMLCKKSYIENPAGDKSHFLDLFNSAEELLEKDYVGYAPTAESIEQFLTADIKLIKAKRRANADVLIERLKSVSGCELIFKSRKHSDTPLFVPIIVDKNRDALRRYLIDNQIYCPVHWPFSEMHGEFSEETNYLYSNELSLVCDQRYSEDDMNRTADLIINFFKGRQKR